jgi:exodeoxyribonuclease-5
MLTGEQEQAIAAVRDWFKSGGKSFYLGGLAGTGKTTLARMFAEAVDGNVMFAAYTGKAASVLRAKGCPGATTLHALIYQPKGDSLGNEMIEIEEELVRERAKDEPDTDLIKRLTNDLGQLRKESKAMFSKKSADEALINDADLVVVDECSMLSQDMGNDLESFGVPILYLGDFGQLPPVSGKPFLDRQPDFTLNEIHRQAKESAIIQVAHKVRATGVLDFGILNDGEVSVLPKADFDWDVALSADQILCGKNVTRQSLNRKVRHRLERSELYPVVGDKLICLQNDKDAGLLNGVGCRASSNTIKRGNIATLMIDYEGIEREFHTDAGHYEANYAERKSFPNKFSVAHFDYGYAITGHKSQGSQWDHVMIADDRMQMGNPDFRRRWLYTAITRAANKLTVYA